MISEMANSEESGDNIPIPNDTINGSNNTLDSTDPDESLIELLASTLLENEPDDTSDLNINELAGEYSALNNAIDEINNYLDRWEARHDHLRAEIFEVLKENQEEEKQDSSAKTSESIHETCISTCLNGSASEKPV